MKEIKKKLFISATNEGTRCLRKNVEGKVQSKREEIPSFTVLQPLLRLFKKLAVKENRMKREARKGSESDVFAPLRKRMSFTTRKQGY